MNYKILSLLPIVLGSTVFYSAYADDLKCDYLYLRQADGSIIEDSHIFKASDDYYGGGLIHETNGCRGKVIAHFSDADFKLLNSTEIQQVYGFNQGLWSWDSNDNTWKLIKMQGLFTQMFTNVGVNQ